MIEVTRGCGVTSQGYLIMLDNIQQYTYYLPYTGIDQPRDLPFTYPGNLPFYKPFNENKSIFLLLTDDDYDDLETGSKTNAQTISSAIPGKMLNDYAVVLFLEVSEIDLKNCDMFDCNNNGEKMTFTPRALLVKKTELPKLQKARAVIPPDIDIPATLQPASGSRTGALQPSKSAAGSKTKTSGTIKQKPISGVY